MSSSSGSRYPFDELRRFASTLLAGVGVSAPRASAMATGLLWFDAAGAASQGIASLADWLGRLDRREIDPAAEGRAAGERAGTAVFDAQNGLAPLVLARAAGIAAEKARDLGIGIVRVHGLNYHGPTAPVLADLAIGPFLAGIVGPGPSMAIASPMPEGLPALYDSRLELSGSPVGSTVRAIPEGLEFLAPWLIAMAGTGGWLIVALSVSAMEPLSGFHERVAGSFRSGSGPGFLAPGPWESRRREARERGVVLEARTTEDLRPWSERFGVGWPAALVR